MLWIGRGGIDRGMQYDAGHECENYVKFIMCQDMVFRFLLRLTPLSHFPNPRCNFIRQPYSRSLTRFRNGLCRIFN